MTRHTSPTAVTRTKAGQRQASIRKLLDAARATFIARGYNGTTLDAIALAADLTKGSIYFYFRSKEAVLLALLDEAEKVVVDPVLAAVEHQSGAVEKLVTFIHRQAELGVREHENMLLIILMSLQFDSGPVGEKLSALYARFYRAMEAVVTEGQASGAFRNDAPARELASLIIANHDGTFLEWHRRSAELNGPRLTAALRALLLAGLRHDG